MQSVATGPRRATLVSDELAEMFGCTAWYIRKSVREQGHFAGVKPIRIGRRIVWPRNAVEEVLKGEIIEEANDETAA